MRGPGDATRAPRTARHASSARARASSPGSVRACSRARVARCRRRASERGELNGCYLFTTFPLRAVVSLKEATGGDDDDDGDDDGTVRSKKLHGAVGVIGGDGDGDAGDDADEKEEIRRPVRELAPAMKVP